MFEFPAGPGDGYQLLPRLCSQRQARDRQPGYQGGEPALPQNLRKLRKARVSGPVLILYTPFGGRRNFIRGQESSLLLPVAVARRKYIRALLHYGPFLSTPSQKQCSGIEIPKETPNSGKLPCEDWQVSNNGVAWLHRARWAARRALFCASALGLCFWGRGLQMVGLLIVGALGFGGSGLGLIKAGCWQLLLTGLHPARALGSAM